MLAGPNKKNFEKKFYKQCKLGWDRNKFCENIISVPLPLAFTKFKCAIRIYV
ncbi:nitrogen fixation protein NifR [Staphylococcus aureus]|nr:nitrogen fixation protein NifR [Staphylococcus aureus]